MWVKSRCFFVLVGNFFENINFYIFSDLAKLKMKKWKTESHRKLTKRWKA